MLSFGLVPVAIRFGHLGGDMLEGVYCCRRPEQCITAVEGYQLLACFSTGIARRRRCRRDFNTTVLSVIGDFR